MPEVFFFFSSLDLDSEFQCLHIYNLGCFWALGIRKQLEVTACKHGQQVNSKRPREHFATVSLCHLVPFVPLPFSSDEFDAYIIVSFVNATLVLSIGETVEEVTDSGFLGTTPTLSCSLLGEDALVQVRSLSELRSGILRK